MHFSGKSLHGLECEGQKQNNPLSLLINRDDLFDSRCGGFTMVFFVTTTIVVVVTSIALVWDPIR